MPNPKTITVNSLEDLSRYRFSEPVMIEIVSGNRLGHPEKIIRNNIVSVKVLYPGKLTTSEDGKMLFCNGGPGSRKKQLIGCFSTDADIVIPDGTEEIGEEVFARNQNIRSVRFPASLRKIHYEAFSGCQNLESVEFSEGLKEINGRAFEKCALKEIVLPASLAVMSNYAFANNARLKSVVFQNNSKMKVLNVGAFYGCDHIASFVFPDNIECLESIFMSGESRRITYEAYRKYHLPGLKKDLKKWGSYFVNSYGECGTKEKLIELLTVYSEGGILDDEILMTTKKIAERNSWTDVIAFVLKYRECAENPDNLSEI